MSRWEEGRDAQWLSTENSPAKVERAKFRDPNLLLAIECPLVSVSGKTHLLKKKKVEKLLEGPNSNLLHGYGYWG